MTQTARTVSRLILSGPSNVKPRRGCNKCHLSVSHSSMRQRRYCLGVHACSWGGAGDQLQQILSCCSLPLEATTLQRSRMTGAPGSSFQLLRAVTSRYPHWDRFHSVCQRYTKQSSRTEVGTSGSVGFWTPSSSPAFLRAEGHPLPY